MYLIIFPNSFITQGFSTLLIRFFKIICNFVDFLNHFQGNALQGILEI